MRSLVRGGLLTAGLVGTGLANAAAMTLPAELTDALASVAVIGAGVFAIIVGIKVYKWVRRAL